MARLDVVHGEWVNLEKPGGQVFFVGGGTVAYKGKGPSDYNKGTDPRFPLATIDGTAGAIAKCTAGRGDTIVVLPGTVTITAAIDLDVADTTLTGYSVTGPNTRNPSVITTATVGDISMINVDAANCVVENLTITNTSTAADSFWIDVGDTTASPGTILRNLFIDCEGAENTGNPIRIGDGSVVSDYCTIEGCTIYDLDDIGITVGASSEFCNIRNCRIMDRASANVALTGITVGASNTAIYDCHIKIDGTCIEIEAGAIGCVVQNSHLCCYADGADCLHITATGSVLATNIHCTAHALEHTVDFDTAVTGLSGVTGYASAPADGSICELLNPNIA